MWNLPPGFMSAMCGTLAAMRLKSSSCSSTPASLAMASRCSTALVEPPSADVTAMAFSNACLVMIMRGVMPRRSMLTTASPARRASSSRRPSIAGGDAVPGSDMPIASAMELIVLAVNMPPHAPSPGHALRSISPSSSSVILPSAHAPTASNTLVMSSATPLCSPGMIDAVVDEHAGQVEAGRGHQHRRDALVAAGEADEAVEPLGVHDALDRVGDDLAADQRGAHALVAHADAVADGDGAELHREAAGGAHAVLGVLGQLAQRHVARRHLVPRRGDGDLRLDPVVVGHADGAQHRPRRRLRSCRR